MAAAGWVRITAAAGEGLPSTGGAGWASCDGWVLLLAILTVVAGRVAIVWLALRGTTPQQRVKILHALAGLLAHRHEWRPTTAHTDPQPAQIRNLRRRSFASRQR